MRFILLASILSLAGCQGFGAGVRDGLMSESPGILADAIDKKLGDDFRDLSDTIRSIPKPPAPEDNTVGYGIGTLIAMIAANALKGGLRSVAKKKSEES